MSVPGSRASRKPQGLGSAIHADRLAEGVDVRIDTEARPTGREQPAVASSPQEQNAPAPVSSMTTVSMTLPRPHFPEVVFQAPAARAPNAA